MEKYNQEQDVEKFIQKKYSVDAYAQLERPTSNSPTKNLVIPVSEIALTDQGK